MTSNAAQSLDVLLIAEEYTEEEDQPFSEHNAIVYGNNSQFSRAVKEQVDALFGNRNLLAPVMGGDGESYRLNLPHRPSLALCDLATVISKAGYSVRIIDNFRTFEWRYEQLKDAIRKWSPRVIGISTTFLIVAPFIRKLVEELRELSPHSRIIIGGQTVRERVDLHDCGDFSVFGEGEVAMLEILKYLDNKTDVESIANIAYRDENGSIRYGVHTQPILDSRAMGVPFKARLDEPIPIADWRHYHRNRNGVYSIEFVRGCKYNCYYCTYDRGMNYRSLDSIRAELVANADLGITRYRIADANFTDGPPRYERYPHDVCQLMIDLDLGLQWSCYSRVNDLDDELVDLMVRAGCFAVFFGIESGDEGILKMMRKGHDVMDAYRGVALARKHGLFVHSNFIVGYPGETRESFGNTLDFIERARPDTVTMGVFYLPNRAPVRGQRMQEFELSGHAMDWSHKTMDSRTAERLVREGTTYLLNQGLVFGSEFEFQGLMSVGFSGQEVSQILKARSHGIKSGLTEKSVSNNLPGWLKRMAEQVAIDFQQMDLAMH